MLEKIKNNLLDFDIDIGKNDNFSMYVKDSAVDLIKSVLSKNNPKKYEIDSCVEAYNIVLFSKKRYDFFFAVAKLLDRDFSRDMDTWIEKAKDCFAHNRRGEFVVKVGTNEFNDLVPTNHSAAILCDVVENKKVIFIFDTLGVLNGKYLEQIKKSFGDCSIFFTSFLSQKSLSGCFESSLDFINIYLENRLSIRDLLKDEVFNGGMAGFKYLSIVDVNFYSLFLRYIEDLDMARKTLKLIGEYEPKPLFGEDVKNIGALMDKMDNDRSHCCDYIFDNFILSLNTISKRKNAMLETAFSKIFQKIEEDNKKYLLN